MSVAESVASMSVVIGCSRVVNMGGDICEAQLLVHSPVSFKDFFS